MSHYKGSGQVKLPSHSSQEGNKLIIKPNALDIIWGNDGRYWRVNATESVAELLQVCWLEVTGSYPLNDLPLKGEREYKVTFTVSTKPDAFGWSDSPVYLMAKVGTQYTWRKADLSQLRNNVLTDIPSTNNLTFKVSANPGDEKVTFGLYEIWRGRWKGGLLIHKVTLEPAA